MSLSSATTLISTTPVVHHHKPRTASHGHAHATMKRRASSHSHTSASGGRRTSDGEGGRRAVVAGLTMHALPGAPKAPRRKSTADRPLTKSSRSDTHLPHLSRTTSITSANSNTSNVSHPGRKRSLPPSRNHSEESVMVLDAEGRPIAAAEEEGWESGDGAEAEAALPNNKVKGKGKEKDAEVDSHNHHTSKSNGAERGAVRRAKSDTTASKPTVLTDAPLIESPLGLPQLPSDTSLDHHTKTTGFSGAVHNPDPAVTAALSQTPIDQDHVRPAHVIQHRLSTANLLNEKSEPDSGESGFVAGSGGDSQLDSKRSSEALKPAQLNANERTNEGERQRKVSGMSGKSRKSSGMSDEAGSKNAPLRSTSGSGLPKEAATDSPHYPFPVVPAEVQQQAPPSSSHPRSRVTSNASQPRVSTDTVGRQNHVSDDSNSTTHRTPSSVSKPAPLPQQQPHTIRHRPSHSSLRSIQSLRAPPHPLNSPTGLRTGTYSALNSPSKSGVSTADNHRRRVSSLHYPPVAPAVVYREIATGKGWETDLPDEDFAETGSIVSGQAKGARADSFSSTRSLQGIMNLRQSSSSTKPGSKLQRPTSPTSSTYSSRTTRTTNTAIATSSSPTKSTLQQPPQPRRLTALASAKAASKLQTTADPAAYHHSLGYPSTSAETAHLISRFLPPKKVTRPKWEITIEEMYESYNNNPGGGIPRVGISKGGYRDAHEALIRSMKEIGTLTEGRIRNTRRGLSRGYSLYSNSNDGGDTAGILEEGSASGGVVLGTSGGQVVRKTGWDGKTPFELSVDRCLAQRPKGIAGI